MPIPILLASAALNLAAPNAPERLGLEGPWQLSQPDRKIDVPAVVPGVVQTDLMRANVLPDPYFGANGRQAQWVSDLPWRYSRSFRVSPAFLSHRRIVLRCEGLDTIATLFINGKEVAKADNMFRTWEFDAKPFLRAGENTIRIDFQSLDAYMKANIDRPKPFGKPVQDGGKHFIRKPPFQGGWDFAPKLLTTGIWQGIGLVGWDAARLTAVGVVQDHSKPGQVDLDVKVDADTAGATKAHVSVLYKGRKVVEGDAPVAQGTAATKLTVRDPKLWWPNGMGPQNLYDVRVELRDARNQVVDRGARRIGLRTVKWIAKTDHNPLALTVNGRRFFAKGSNWVPLDSLLRPDPKRERRLVQDAIDANMNLMRLWGGGYYEADSFFDICDEKGLLVWFEFKYADAPYPSFDPTWLANARAEAEDQVRRVRHHPSIAVYSGNNEVIGFIRDTTTESAMNREEYNLLFHQTLRDVVRDLAPDAAYTPGSPEIGDDHYWDVWHGSATFASYRNLHGFMSEYGFQAFPVPRSVEQFTTADDRASIATPVMLEHQKNWRDGNALIFSTSLRTYRRPKDFESTLWLGQINQAEGILTGVEHWRRDWPNSTGSLVWQYNDPWPVTSWSMIDYYGRPKALYYRLKHAYAPVALSGLADGQTGKVGLWVVNDRTEAKSGRIEWTLTRLDGSVVERGSVAVTVPAGTSSVQVLDKDLKAVVDREGASKLLLWATLRTPGEPESKTLLTFARAKELDLVDPAIEATVIPSGKGYRVTLRSARPALYAWIELKGMDAELSDNFIHLQPGVPATIDVEPAAKVSLDQVKKALVTRSLVDTYLPGTEAYPKVRPDAQGRIVATADEADIQGEGPVLEVGVQNNLGNWRSANNAIRWTVLDAKAGTYAITALVSAPASDAGGTFEVEVDGSRVTATVPATKSWTDYVEMPLGTLTIAKNGTAILTLRPLTKPHDNLMNLRLLILTPITR
jgi:beta-mannosidase